MKLRETGDVILLDQRASAARNPICLGWQRKTYRSIRLPRVQQAMVDYLRGGDVSKTKIALPPLEFNGLPK